MKTKLVLASLCLLSIGAATPAGAAGGDDASLQGDEPTPKETGPYSMIIARNVFRLNPIPPPPPPPTNDTTAAAAGGLKLTGFFKSGAAPVRALFVNVPSNPTNTVYYNLTEGERDGALELIKINIDAESAEVVHAGVRATVMLKDSKPASTGGAPGQPGAPGVVPGVPPRPAVANVPSPVAAPAQNPQAAAGWGAQYQNSQGVQSSGGVMVSGGIGALPGGDVPSRTVRANTQTQNTGPQPQTREEATAIASQYAAEHAAEISAGALPPPPPLPMPPGVTPVDNGSSSQQPSIQLPSINPRKFPR